MMMAVMLWGCSEESEQKNSVPENPLRLSGVTRAPSDVTAATDSLSPIQIFLMSGLEKTEGNFVYNTTRGEWISTIGVKELENYVYGFAPAMAAKGQVRTVTSGATDYSEGCVMTLDELTAIGGEDLCVVTGVKADKTPITEVPEFGTFKFDKQSTTNYIGLLLDHLYGAIEFKIKVGARYSERRDIWLKKMALTSTQAVTQATVTLKANTTGGNPITDVRYTTAEGEQTNTCYDYGTDPTTTKGLLLTTEGTRFREKGDRLTISEGGASKTAARYMIDRKVPAALRDRIVLPMHGKELLWFPGGRISAAFKVTEATKNVIEITWKGRHK